MQPHVYIMNAMRKLLTHVLLLHILIITTILATRFAGSRTPAPESLSILHLDQCMRPCWLGIWPGKATMDEAWEIVQKYYKEIDNVTLTREDNAIVITLNNNSEQFFHLYIFSDVNQGIESIMIDIWTTVSLDEFQYFLGFPSVIESTEEIGGYKLYYGNKQQIAWLGGIILDCSLAYPQHMVYVIYFYPPEKMVNVETDTGSLISRVKWQSMEYLKKFVCS